MANRGADVPARVVDGFTLARAAAWRLSLPRGSRLLRIPCSPTDSGHLPTAYVELRSAFINEVGLERAFADSVGVVRSLIPALSEPHVSRIDLFADYGGFPTSGVIPHLVAREIAFASFAS